VYHKRPKTHQVLNRVFAPPYAAKNKAAAEPRQKRPFLAQWFCQGVYVLTA